MTYEYVCEACGHQWEAQQSIKDKALKTCVSCGAEKAKRLVSGGTGFLLKGGGWYADLYGSPGAGAAKAGADDKSNKTGTSDTKSESATEAKPAAAESKPAADTKAASGSATPTTTAAPSTAAKAS
jgi:putative FmdB family regulatory protein